jgi:hypothetical protein
MGPDALNPKSETLGDFDIIANLNITTTARVNH